MWELTLRVVDSLPESISNELKQMQVFDRNDGVSETSDTLHRSQMSPSLRPPFDPVSYRHQQQRDAELPVGQSNVGSSLHHQTGTGQDSMTGSRGPGGVTAGLQRCGEDSVSSVESGGMEGAGSHTV